MKVVIDGKECSAAYGEYILQAADRCGIRIPTLCHSEALPEQGNCRLCIVEVIEKGRSKIVTSCIYPLTTEVEVLTNTPRIRKMRKTLLMLLLARCPENEVIRKMAGEYGIEPPTVHDRIQDTAIKIDDNCILCGLCVRACEEMGLNAISTVQRGIKKKVSTPFDEESAECIGCGACANVCPTGAIKIVEENGKRVIWNKTFELLQCKGCGEYYLTREQLEHLQKHYGLGSEVFLCGRCKMKETSSKFKEIFGE